MKSLSHVQLSATPWTTAYQAPLSMGFSRQEYWSGVPLPSPRKKPKFSFEVSLLFEADEILRHEVNQHFGTLTTSYVTSNCCSCLDSFLFTLIGMKPYICLWCSLFMTVCLILDFQLYLWTSDSWIWEICTTDSVRFWALLLHWSWSFVFISLHFTMWYSELFSEM